MGQYGYARGFPGNGVHKTSMLVLGCWSLRAVLIKLKPLRVRQVPMFPLQVGSCSASLLGAFTGEFLLE